MKVLAYTLFLFGLLVASGYAARAVHPEGTGAHGAVTASDRLSAWGSAAGLPFGVGLVIMLGGGLLARRKTPRPKANGEGTTAHAPAEIGPMLDGMLARFDELPKGPPSEHAESMRGVLDKLLEEDVPTFLDQREEMIADLGLATYAMAIGQFAIMERNAARAWSALTDEAWDEVRPSLERARTGLEHARETVASATPNA